MGSRKPFDMSASTDLIAATQSILSNMNIGFIIYHMEDLQKIESIRFIYANDEASKYTGTDLSKLTGKYLSDAFPELTKTDVPEMFAEVARTKKASNIGVMEYSDENVKQGAYAIKAFPLPDDCIGVAFENITTRKQMEQLVKDYTDKLSSKNEELESLISTIYNEIIVPLQRIRAKSEELKSRSKNKLSTEDHKLVVEISENAKHLVQSIQKQIISSRDKKTSDG